MSLVVKAIHTFVAEHGDELEFQAGESITVLEKDDAFGDGWWRGRNERGEEGLFPATYITQGGESEAEPVKKEAPSGADTESIRSVRRSPSPARVEPEAVVGDDESVHVPPVITATTVVSEPAVPAASPPSASTPLLASSPHSIPPVTSIPPVAVSPVSSAPKTFSPPRDAEISLPPSPKNVESSLDTVDGSKGLIDTAADAASAVAVGAGTVLNRTLGEIQDVIEQIAKPESDDEEVGIDTNARARLAAQAKLANEQRDKHISGDVTGLVYSDESDSEDDDQRHSFGVFGTSAASGNGFTAANGGKPDYGNIKASPLDSTFANSGTAPLGNRRVSNTSVRTPLEFSSSLQPAFALPTTPAVRAAMASKPPIEWSVDEVVAWVESKAFDDTICARFREHEITGDLLLELDANLLKELDIPQFGKRLRIAQAISDLRRPPSASSHEITTRGMSAPPAAVGPPMSATPPLNTPPSSAPSDSAPYSAWTHSRRASSTTTPATMGPIAEDKAHTPAPSTAISSVPSSPVTPNSSVTKRESTGSMGHKRGKPSMDRDRLSFFGRNRKPAPSATSPGENKTSRLASSNRVHQMQPATPERARNVSTTGAPGTAMAVRQIGTPDHSGFMKKKGDRYSTWKMRYFVLKGSHLYYLKSEQEDRVKGHIDVSGCRIIVDENVNPGQYGFRLVGSDRPHAFSSPEQTVVREWMKALTKATIARDYSVAVTSSCNIPTIPLAEAQALAPRPPSPATREATQRATRRENTNQLTAHDASVLMSLDTSKRASQTLTPGRPSRDTRRPSNPNLSSNAQDRPTTVMSTQTVMSNHTSTSNDDPHARELVEWVNAHLPPSYPKAASLPGSFVSGEVIFLLVRALSGLEPSPPVAPNAFAPEGGLPGLSGLFAMMDLLIDAGIDTAGVSINDIRQGDKACISRLIESIQVWNGAKSGVAR